MHTQPLILLDSLLSLQTLTGLKQLPSCMQITDQTRKF